jgi:hypothetical protein
MSLDPDTLLRRREGAAALKAAGYPTAPATLATLACRGGGPPFRRFGRVPLYRWADLLDWARSRLGPVVHSTAEADVARPPAIESAARVSVVRSPQAGGAAKPGEDRRKAPLAERLSEPRGRGGTARRHRGAARSPPARTATERAAAEAAGAAEESAL